jgi:acetoin utilization protein AcuB
MSIRIARYMTARPFIIGPTQTLLAARRMMRDRGVRHLPVVDQGRLVGILSERDLLLLQTFDGIDPDLVHVHEAMTIAPYSVPPDAHAVRTWRTMLKRRHGCVVVVDDGKVVGIFTASDALRALADHLEPANA